MKLAPARLEQIAARPCTCHLCPPGIGCAPCWARDELAQWAAECEEFGCHDTTADLSSRYVAPREDA